MITFLRDLVCKDFWLKLFSLVLALLIWFTVNIAVQNEIPTERVFDGLPVVILSSSGDVRNFKVQPSAVAVTARGDARLLQRIESKDFRVMVDLTGIEAAHDLWKRIEVSTPAGITQVRVEPEQVRVVFASKN